MEENTLIFAIFPVLFAIILVTVDKLNVMYYNKFSNIISIAYTGKER
jgi:hypothetical protein